MTDTYHAPSPAPASAPPVPPREHPDPADTESIAVSPPAPPTENAPSAAPAHEAPPQEGERYVWQPPVPQFPPRPSQAPPVQYQGPQMQQPPVYAPQGQYVPPNQYAPPAPGPAAPQPAPPQQAQQVGITATYAAPTYAPPTQVFAPPPSPGARRGRVGRQMARRAVRSMGGVGKGFSGRRLPLTALFLLLLGLIAWLGVDKISASRAPKLTPNAVSTAPIVLPPEADAVKTYLNATRADDVEGGWNALNATVKSDRLSQGDDKTVMKAYLDKLAQSNVVPTYRFVGAYGALSPNDFSKGGTYYYVQEVSLQGKVLNEPMTFIVDENGKISYVFDFLYHALAKVPPGLPPTK